MSMMIDHDYMLAANTEKEKKLSEHSNQSLKLHCTRFIDSQ